MVSENTELMRRKKLYGNVLELIGDTPLIEVRSRNTAPSATIFGKWEVLNPGGSIKDRVCLAMIEQAERDGKLGPGGIVVEPTSGNTGIGLALVASRRGYRCILTMPESMSLERRRMLESLGAEVVLTPAHLQMQGAIDKAREILSTLPKAFMPGQFDNAANPQTHYERTSKEIVAALGDMTIGALVAGVGTGGTISGVGRRLRELYPACRIIAVEPESCATLSRGERGPTKIQGIGAGFVPGNFDRAVPHEIRTVTDARAWETKLTLAKTQGLLVGITSGANVAISEDVAAELGPGTTVVTVLCDTGERYFSLSEHFEP